MKGFKVFLMLAMLMASTITTLSAITDEEESFFNEENNTDAKDETKNQFEKSTPLRSRLVLASRPTGMTCDRYSKVCRASVSAGPDCCKKKCVDRNTDRANCGSVGGNASTQRFAAKVSV